MVYDLTNPDTRITTDTHISSKPGNQEELAHVGAFPDPCLSKIYGPVTAVTAILQNPGSQLLSREVKGSSMTINKLRDSGGPT